MHACVHFLVEIFQAVMSMPCEGFFYKVQCTLGSVQQTQSWPLSNTYGIYKVYPCMAPSVFALQRAAVLEFFSHPSIWSEPRPPKLGFYNHSFNVSSCCLLSNILRYQAFFKSMNALSLKPKYLSGDRWPQRLIKSQDDHCLQVASRIFKKNNAELSTQWRVRCKLNILYSFINGWHKFKVSN